MHRRPDPTDDKDGRITSSSGRCPTRLLDDAPSENDDLAPGSDVGPHSRIARAIADVMRTEEQSAGRMIGIEGGWGAGKTTVIRLLRKALQSDPDTRLFLFDAWAHRGDPLRRTFLESLVEHLRQPPVKWISDSQWYGEDGWRNKLDALAKRRRQTTTTTVPRTTVLGRFFAVAALLVPLGAAMVSGSLDRPLVFSPRLPIPWHLIAWDFVIGAMLALLPLLVVGVYSIIAIIQRFRKREISWAFVHGDATVTRRTEETDTPDPTSLEFELMFDRLMSDAIGSRDRRRLILVLDNLDRVDAQDALSIWSTLQTFLQFDGKRHRDWMRRLWVVVPYDPNGLRALWEGKAQQVSDVAKETGESGEPAVDSNSVQPSGDDGMSSHRTTSPGMRVAESFLDKSFQIRFELPPPVLSNWRSYLRTLIAEALPEHAEDADILARVYSLTQPGHRPTPRELKLYVNQIGMVHRQWGCDLFPITHIAYYAVLARRRIDVADAVVELPDPGITSLVPSTPQDIQESLAGLAFNVDPKLGMEIVLKDRIFRALTSGRPERVEELANGYSSGFWTLLGDTAHKELMEATTVDLEKAIRCSVKCKVLTGDAPDVAKVLFQTLASCAARRDTRWALLGAATGEALGLLAGILDSTKRTAELADSIRRSAKLKGKEPAIREGLLECIFAFVRRVQALGHSEALREPFVTGGNAEQWIEMTTAMVEMGEDSDDPVIWSRLQPGVSAELIVQALVEKVEGGEAQADLATAVRVTHEAAVEPDWQPLAKACQKRMHHAQNASGAEADVLLRVLFYLHGLGHGEALANVVNNGDVYHCLHHSESRKHAGCRSLCCVATMLVKPDLAKAKNMPGSAEAGWDYLHKRLLPSTDEGNARPILDALVEERTSNALFATISTRGQFDPLLARVLQLFVDESCCAMVPTDFVLDHWPAVADAVNDEDDSERFLRLVQCLSEDGTLVEDLCETDFDVTYVSLYGHVAKGGSQKFLAWCVAGIKGVDKDDWADALCGRNQLLEFVAALTDHGATVEVPHEYLDALVEFSERVMRGDTQVSEAVTSGLFDIFAVLRGPGMQAEFCNRCANDMVEQGASITDQFFDLFGPTMLVPEYFRTDNAISELFSALVQARHARGLRWLRQLLKQAPDLIDERREIASSFRSRVAEEIAKTTGDEAGSTLSEIAGDLRIDGPEMEELGNKDVDPAEGPSKETEE